MHLIHKVRACARSIKRDALTLWFARRHPDAPLISKLLAAFVVAYALSPIDLIPDFIPVLGYVDDVLLLPGLIWLAIRLLPASVLDAARLEAETWITGRRDKPRSVVGAAVIISIWLIVAVAISLWAARHFQFGV